MNPNNSRHRIAVALDLPEASAALSLAQELQGTVGWMKVATTLLTRSGPSVVGDLCRLGFKVFLDLKFHDIPAQVEGAARSAAQTGASLITVHASGGTAMLQAALRGVEGSPCQVVAVTVLTSLDAQDLTQMGVPHSPEAQVDRLARMAHEAGVHGIVCSPLELSRVRALLPKPFLMVTPGIRPTGADLGDQKRVLTPPEALAQGADLLVIGRPIVRASSPKDAAQAIVDSMGTA